MPARVLIDTNLLVDYFRRHPAGVAFMRGLTGRPAISAITVAELYTGVRDGQERTDLDLFIARSVVIDTDVQISVRAGLMLRQYRKSHGVGLADALIASTVEAENATLATLNPKHFPMLSNVLVPYTKP
jgi:predicted nucleic acid-binding protein